MSVTLTLGWWLVPLLFTVVSFALSIFVARDDGHGDYSAIAGALVSVILFGAATIISLVAWLIWALLA